MATAPVRRPVRTLLVTGDAGAGRTTVAAAFAAAAAGYGDRTLLLTADAEAVPGLDDPAAVPAVGDAPPVRAVAGLPGLAVAAIDPPGAFRAALLEAQEHTGALLTLLGAPPLDPEEVTELPGADALALLRALRRAQVLPDENGAATGWDLVVVDLPPVREAVRLLALPEQLRRYLRRLLPADRTAARALRPVLAQLAGVPMPAEWAYQAAERADRELAAVQAVVEDPATAVAVVAEPGDRAARTVRTARTGLALYGHRTAAVVANRVLPTGSDDPFLARLSAAQQDHLKTLAEHCAADGVPLLELPHLGRAPRPLAAPAELPLPVPEAEPRAVEPWTVVDRLADEGHFLWSLPLPGAGREGLDLVRRGDELVVDAGGFRRILPLPSALRRCTVRGAALRDGALQVRFTPDPDLWPR
ncbi:ArsA family ATPase [Actinacidiphila yeochonensis]|uniref:ArsA family ATPase n=1 Tax=Actinacidiphila yeochonensis TaxID=89050 RepID=UPI001E368577|nr:ArsA-related P-loop ATPase [Actinacidiphila yeochonensis]